MSESELMPSYYFYSAVLAFKLLALAPIALFVCNGDKFIRVSRNGLANVTPFWLLSGMYMTTNPDRLEALMLLRAYVAARILSAATSFCKVPEKLKKLFIFVAYGITMYMVGKIILTYHEAF